MGTRQGLQGDHFIHGSWDKDPQHQPDTPVHVDETEPASSPPHVTSS